MDGIFARGAKRRVQGAGHAGDFLPRKPKMQPEDFLKKREADFLAGREGDTKPVVCLPHPPVRAPTPSLAGLKPAKLPLDKYVDSE